MSQPLDIRIISNLSSPDWWNIGFTSAAAIAGAVIGAGISYLVALRTANDSRREAQFARLEQEKMSTYRLGIKLLDLVNSAAGYHRGAQKAIQEAKNQLRDGNFQTWKGLKAFTGQPIEITLESSDLFVLWKARELALVSRIVFVVANYNAMIYNVEDYGKRRDALMMKFKPEMTGLVGSFYLDDLERRTLSPEIASIQDLADQALQHIQEVFEEGLKIVDEFGPIVRKYFDDPEFPVPGRIKETWGNVATID